MKLNFSLDKLELYLNDSVLLEAETLLGSKNLTSLSEVEKNLFLARYTEGVESEVQLSGTKVKMATCDCNNFGQQEICKHIAATLIELLERHKEKIESKKASTKSSISTNEAQTKLTIPNILKRIEPAQLIEFIADYARSDKQFALALKTRFASDLSAGTIEEHYRTLIDNTLRTVKNAKGRVTPKGWQQVFTMIDELKQKSETFFKNGELNASFELVKITLPLIHRFMRSSESPKAKLERRQVQLTEVLRGFAELRISPELNQRLWNFVLLEYTQNVRQEFSERLFDWLLKNTNTAPQVETLLQSIDAQIILCHNNLSIIKDRLLTQKIQVLQKSGRVQEASQLILSSSSQPDVLFFAIENAFTHFDLELAKNLSQNGLRIFHNNNTVKERLEEYLLSIAEKESDTEGVFFYAEKRLLATCQLSFFEKLKKLNISPDKINKIIQKIEKQPYRLEKRDLLAAIYVSEKQFDKLIDMIMAIQSLELLKHYGFELYQYDAESALIIHKKIIYEYLYTHLGRAPAQRIRQILETLIAYGGRNLAELLKQDLKMDFPERYSLNEELEDMLADLERKAILNN